MKYNFLFLYLKKKIKAPPKGVTLPFRPKSLYNPLLIASSAAFAAAAAQQQQTTQNFAATLFQQKTQQQQQQAAAIALAAAQIQQQFNPTALSLFSNNSNFQEVFIY